jgi:serpin B
MNRFALASVLVVALVLTALAGCGSPSSPNVPPGSSLVISDKPRDLNPVAVQGDLSALVEGNAAFATDLYAALRRGPGNLFFSPYSISTALAMTYAGAAGETASQMATALHFDLPAERLHPAFNAYALDLEARAAQATEGTPFELSIANSLWGQKDFPFRGEFLDQLGENYGAGMRLVDYTADPEAARRAINAWVSDETREKIQDLIPEGAVDAMTRLVLANAIYFKAGWLHPFEDSATGPEPFHLLDGSTLEVTMMHQTESYGYAIRDGYRALELPYLSGNTSMLIILPDEGEFEAVEEGWSPEMLQDITGNLAYGPVILTLPKFSYSSSFSLNDALIGLGMPDAFDPDRADFSGMDDARDLYISDVLHKAFVWVDEKGTEAAAATAVIMSVTSAPADEPIAFTIDRPFLYLIRDGQTGTILFLGRVLNPAE